MVCDNIVILKTNSTIDYVELVNKLAKHATIWEADSDIDQTTVHFSTLHAPDIAEMSLDTELDLTWSYYLQDAISFVLVI